MSQILTTHSVFNFLRSNYFLARFHLGSLAKLSIFFLCVWGSGVFVWGNNFLGKIGLVLRSKCSSSAVAWGRLTAGEVGAGLAAEDVAVLWWLEERRLVDADHWVKTVEVYRSACSS